MRGIIKVERPDGLAIFPTNKDPDILNRIRKECPDKEQVILAVGIYRGMQIAMNYAEKHAPEVKNKINNALQNFTNSLHLLKGGEHGLRSVDEISMDEADHGFSKGCLAMAPCRSVEIQTAEVPGTGA